MDWNKLQRKLFDLDPSDPREDLAKLTGQTAASKAVAKEVDYITESVDVRKGSLTLDRDYSVTDFAALAGIKITEGKQKEGPAGQAKHKDPAPKKIPAGSTKNISRDKLVGDSMDQDIEEAGALDAFRQGIQDKGQPDWAEKKLKGFANPNGSSSSGDSTPPKKKIDTQRMITAFGVKDPAFKTAIQKMNQPGGQNMTPGEAQALAKAFSNMMSMSPRDIQRNMNIIKSQVTGTESVNYEQETIKERLYRELNKKLR